MRFSLGLLEVFIVFRRVTLIFGIMAILASPAWAGKKDNKDNGIYRELDIFTRILGLVQEDYVENPDQKEMVYGAIRGMLSTLDPHSVFMPPDAYRELKVDTEGRFGGVGMEVTIKDNTLTVVTAIEGTPAQKAGVREGDRILKIDGVPTRELGLAEAVRRMRGARGTKVHLTLVRQGAREPMDVTLARDIIRIKSVRWEVPEDGIGYIRITSFQENTTEELQKAMEAMDKKGKDPIKGLVLDLRNNPGGLLDEAVDVSDLFLDSGIIVTTASRNHEIDRRIANRSGAEPIYSIVLMVNGGSASAAEIVAGALQDNKRAVVLGTKSFGKGTVQTIFELGEGAALKLTVAKYYTPKGRSIQADGIHPDIVVEAQRPSPSGVKGEGQSRSSNVGGTGRPGPETAPKAQSDPEEDYQKSVALDYLMGRNVPKKKKR